MDIPLSYKGSLQLPPHHVRSPGDQLDPAGYRPAELVVELEEGRTYFDLADSEAEAEALLRRRVNVTPGGAPGAHPREPTRATRARSGCVSTPEELAAQLDAATHGLHNIRRLVSEGERDAFDASEDRTRAWPSAG